MICPSCGTNNPPGGKFCDRCGTRLPEAGLQPGQGNGASWVMGSDPGCDLLVASATVSGRHCRLTLLGSSFWLEDLGSTNGTFVDGARIAAPVAVTRNSQITLGRQAAMPWPATPNGAMAPPMAVPPPLYQPPLPAFQAAPVFMDPTGFRYAGFWIRFVAILIDSFIVGVGGFLVGFFFTLATAGLGACLAPFLGIAATWLYFALMESSKSQGTLGKMALGLKVVDLQGRRITFGRATGRHFSRFLSAIILYIGYMMAGWTEKKQGLHDMIAGTCVLKPS
jgi:uncharacterized RDD family membrane protein YckC